MLEGGTLSARRNPPSPRSPLFTADGDDPAGDDESKTRKPASFSFSTRLGRVTPAKCFLPAIIALILLASFLFLGRPSSSVSISPLPRLPLFRPGLAHGLPSDFGSLGVPTCRSRQGRTVPWTEKDLLKALEEFVPIYETRPNKFGMGFDHSFGLWFMARWLKPELVIESGAYKGHSTWVIRQALPGVRIASLSPRHPDKHLKKGEAYVDENCTYLAGKDFVDFGSVEWGDVLGRHGVSDFVKVLVFFDDHQNQLKRLKQSLKAGFRNIIFEDNYDTGTGDHYSMRQICDQFYIRGGGHSCILDSDEARVRKDRNKFWDKAVDIEELCGDKDAWWGVRGEMRDDFNRNNKAISYREHFLNSRFVESVLDVYWELPPVAGPSLTHQTRYDPGRVPDPIIEDGRFGLFQKLGLSRLDSAVFNGYTQMVYLQVSALPHGYL